VGAALAACVRWPPVGAATRVPSDEALLRAKALMVPVAGREPARLRDDYDARRGGTLHAALDILAPRGTPVLAADAGRIVRLRTSAAGGTTIYQLDSSQRFVYYYAHLERYRDGLSEGMEVRQGDVIGFVGTSGNAPPGIPHLHFQLMRYRGDGRYTGGEPLNPFPYFVRRGVIPGA
jgi:murein DD-endopeptidase MepM/ murein hydrolase activator NlpD